MMSKVTETLRCAWVPMAITRIFFLLQPFDELDELLVLLWIFQSVVVVSQNGVGVGFLGKLKGFFNEVRAAPGTGRTSVRAWRRRGGSGSGRMWFFSGTKWQESAFKNPSSRVVVPDKGVPGAAAATTWAVPSCLTSKMKSSKRTPSPPSMPAAPAGWWKSRSPKAVSPVLTSILPFASSAEELWLATSAALRLR